MPTGMTEQQETLLREEIEVVIERAKEAQGSTREEAWNAAAAYAPRRLNACHIAYTTEVRQWVRQTIIALLEKWYGPVIVEGSIESEGRGHGR